MEKDYTSNPNPEADKAVETNEIVEANETVESSETIVEEAAKPLFAKEPKNPTAPKPKKKIGLIIGICVAAVLLIGGALATIFLVWRQSDTVVLLDAVTGVIKETKASVAGSMYIEFNESSQSEAGVKSMKIDLKSAEDATSARADSTLVVTTTNDEAVTIGIGGAFVSDGVFYLKLDGIKDAVSAFDVPDDAAAVLGYLEDLIEDIDGEWYKLSASDLNLSSKDKDTYNCLVDVINMKADADSNDELADLYKKHSFIFSEKHGDSDSKGNSVYDVKVDPDVFADFVDGAEDTKVGKALSECPIGLTDFGTEDDDSSPTPEGTATISLHIDSWSHQLRGISMNSDIDGTIMDSEFYLEYGDNVKVEIPENAKSVSDLMGSVEDVIKKIVTEQLREQVAVNCSSYAGTSYYDQCLASANKWIEEYLEGIDFSDLFSLSTGKIIQET